MLSSMVEGVVALDSEGRVLFLNDAVEKLFQVRKLESRGKPLLEVLRHSALQNLTAETGASNQPQVQEIQLFLPQETCFQVHAVPAAFSNGRGTLIVLHDITRLRKLEEARREFVANVSHELRTPLASVKGYAETLLTGALDDKAHAREFVRIIEKHADDLTRLVDDLLDLSSIESGANPLAREEVGVESLLRESMDRSATLALKKNVRLELSAVSPGLKVLGDRKRLLQVFSNLLDNAVQYNQPGGKVELSAETVGPEIRISIRDSGSGIAPEDLGRIFERFYRADKARTRESGGTGLGLAIAKHIVENHKGRITVESALGQGSLFRVLLPGVP